MKKIENPLRYEPGYKGAFTRDHVAGAFDNGTIVEKVRGDTGDAHMVGDHAKILGSIRNPLHPRDGIMYFIEWDDMPRQAVACADWKLQRVIRRWKY